MDFTPQTVVKVLKNVPLDNTYKDTLSFSTPTEQANFFNSKLKFNHLDFTYQRTERAIYVPDVAESYYDCNYVMFQNLNFGAKWFYAFITRVQYVNPNTTALYIEIDAMQTWYFDYEIKPSFIERETVDNDNLFEHTIPESLEFGPPRQADVQVYDMSSMAIVLAYMPTDGIDVSGGELRERVYTGLKYVWYGNSSSEINALNTLIQSFAKAGYLDNIVSIFMVPGDFVLGTNTFMDIHRNYTSIDGYTPRNNKLFVYPYHYFAVNNMAGSEHIYRYELFRNPTHFIFNIEYIFNMESSASAHPMDYNGVEENWDEGVVLSQFPVCSWRGNVYANWFARNRLSIGQQFLSQGINVVQGAASSISTLNPGAAISSINQIMGSVAQLGDKALYPYQIQGQVSCDVANVKWHRVGYEVKGYSIHKEYAQIIDSFFDAYGYKVNRIGVPNLTSRESWNYIKTIDIKIIGSIPVEQLDIIKSCYNRGITFWHGDYVGDYNRSNVILAPPPAPSWPAPTPAPGPTPPPEPAQGWGWPLVGWQNHVTSEFGWRTNPITGEQQFHQGIDISAPKGEPALAISAGTVVSTGSSPARGNYIDVTVDGMDGTAFYRYQHCDSLLFHVGDKVLKEQGIAIIGETGQVTGPHLHVEIFINGEAVNPRKYMVEKS